VVKPTGADLSVFDVERAAVARALVASGTCSAQSLPRVADLLERFCPFVEQGFGTASLSDVSAVEAAAFVGARTAEGSPSVATMHLRRTTIRLVFRTARSLGIADSDPTLDLELPPRSSLRTRPLTDDEVDLCRTASLHTLTSTRFSAAWALAEASARTAELGHICLADVDLGSGRVWLHGSPRVESRWAGLSGWGQVQLERRLREVGTTDLERPILYEGSGGDYHRQAAACVTIKDVLRRAGLAHESDVRPLSVTAWAGRQILAEVGRIDEVARRLGFRSLDGAARLIDWSWREPAGSGVGR
jgi:integrase